MTNEIYFCPFTNNILYVIIYRIFLGDIEILVKSYTCTNYYILFETIYKLLKEPKFWKLLGTKMCKPKTKEPKIE